MSTPISVCQISKAALGDEKAFKFLVEALDYNLSWEAMTIFPCEHNPKYPKPTEAQLAALGDEKAFKFLVEALDYNLSWEAMTIFPCEHNPKCPKPTEAQLDALSHRLMTTVAENRRERAKGRPTPKFDKTVFPPVKASAAPVTRLEDIFPGEAPRGK